MSVAIGPVPAPVDQELLTNAEHTSFATWGHYLERGFTDPGIVWQSGPRKIVGTAITVELSGADSTMLHHIASRVRGGDVVVISMGGDCRHAPLGLVVAEALVARGAVAAIVDGVVTDHEEVAQLPLAVFARGKSLLTTKLLGSDDAGWNVPISCGGATVTPGDLVLADVNGALFVSPTVAGELVDTILEDDAEEPQLVDAVRGGAVLGELTGASATINQLKGINP